MIDHNKQTVLFITGNRYCSRRLKASPGPYILNRIKLTTCRRELAVKYFVHIVGPQNSQDRFAYDFVYISPHLQFDCRFLHAPAKTERLLICCNLRRTSHSADDGWRAQRRSAQKQYHGAFVRLFIAGLTDNIGHCRRCNVLTSFSPFPAACPHLANISLHALITSVVFDDDNENWNWNSQEYESETTTKN